MVSTIYLFFTAKFVTKTATDVAAEAMDTQNPAERTVLPLTDDSLARLEVGAT